MGTVFTWSDLQKEELMPGLLRQMLWGDKAMLARIELKKGVVVPEHRHENEQLSCVLEGALQFMMDGREMLVETGQVLHIPSNALHSTTALEDSVLIDVFAPPRHDWIRGEVGYLKNDE